MFSYNNQELSLGLRGYLNQQFDTENERVEFVSALLNNKKNISNITFEECEEFLLWLCGAYDQENPDKEEE